MNLFGISSEFTVSPIRIAERSFRNLSGVEKFMFDKTRSNNLLAKNKRKEKWEKKDKEMKSYFGPGLLEGSIQGDYFDPLRKILFSQTFCEMLCGARRDVNKPCN